MPSSGYFDTIFGASGTLVTVPDAIQGDGSVSYTQGWGVDYTLPSSNPSYKYMPQGQFNQLFYDITAAIQTLQQGSPPAFITSAMNGGSPYSYPKGAKVSLGGANYVSLTASNTTTPPGANWANSWGANTGSFTVGHIATFSDTSGTIQDGGAAAGGTVTSIIAGTGLSGGTITSSGTIALANATTSVIGGVKPDGTIITISAGAITVAKASSSLFGVAKVDNTTITASAGVISTSTPNFYQAQPSNPTGTTSTTGVMMGLAGTITPNATGVVAFDIVGACTNSSTFATSTMQIRYGTGAAPTNGGALTGTAIGAAVANSACNATNLSAFALSATVSGLTLGTAYWFDIELFASTTTSSIKDLALRATEIK